MALHVARAARALLGLQPAESLAGGKLELPAPAAARELADLLRSVSASEPVASAGELYALAGLEAALQSELGRHLRERDPGALEGLLHRGQQVVGVEETERLLTLFSRDFVLPGSRETVLREFVVWSVIADNPAAAPMTARLHDGAFSSDPALRRLREGLRAGDGGDPRDDDLMSVLGAPARAEPDSLVAQVRWVLEEWGDSLGAERVALLRGLDVLAEEAKRFTFAQPGPGPAEVPSFSDLEDEPENFSPDLAWMPGVVLLAKNAYVWLDQLSRRFDRPVRRLDEIPDEALDEIAGRGVNALWLIGVWERSAASQRLKRLCGNPEAVASAYSLRRYRIAADLGGDGALADLVRRAMRRGIRLGSDMVPNHLGLDSDWLLRHPDRFLSLAECPFSVYTFGGPDLSPDPAVGIFVEDHYYDRSDAAVVFKRLDRRTGEVRYVYHGNDGTSTPWNDTAQLDYLNPETREAVIREILEVARRFPLIRFDAAMTLARRHYQRLWFPAPGTGGAVPSRAEHGLDRDAFGARMPEEFWREVVDRVAREAPGTLLLAEAFWLMEGYFVRTLGMHRVYNSAFMNMLRDRENAKYRNLIKETLAFDPRILQRYVNFLTNPDERTAIDQFGRYDRYFGACALLATLPGLPMLGHGQIEGLTEKYGMEFRRAYRDETADAELVARHEREIAPLLKRREVFAGVENFELYDFVDSSGAVNDDVLAYSNGAGDDLTVVVFNNTTAPAVGSLRRAVARVSRPQRTFAEATGLGAGGSVWLFRDRMGGRTYLRAAAHLVGDGLALELGAFAYRVCDGFRVVKKDSAGRYRRLCARLGLAGVENLEEALDDLDLEPAAEALSELLARPALAHLRAPDAGDELVGGLVDATVEVLWRLDAAGGGDGGGDGRGEENLRRRLEPRLRALGSLPKTGDDPVYLSSDRMRGLHRDLAGWLAAGPEVSAGLAVLHILDSLDAVSCLPTERLRRLPLEETLGPVLDGLGAEPGRVGRTLRVLRVAWTHGWAGHGELPGADEVRALAERWRGEPALQSLIGPRVGGDGELEDLLNWRVATGLGGFLADVEDREERAAGVAGWLEVGDRLKDLTSRAGYDDDKPRPAGGKGDTPPESTASE